MSEFPLVMVEWEDSAQPMSKWVFIENLPELSVVNCVSVGWLIVDEPDLKAIAPNLGDKDGDTVQAGGIIRIPARAITRMVMLKEVDTE